MTEQTEQPPRPSPTAPTTCTTGTARALGRTTPDHVPHTTDTTDTTDATDPPPSTAHTPPAPPARELRELREAREAQTASSGTARRPAAPTGLRPLGLSRRWPRSFADRLTAPLPGVRAMARLAREGALRPPAAGLKDIPRLPFSPGPLPDAEPGTVAVTWAGHASWVIGIGELTVLTDPVWSRRILGTPARLTPVGVRWEDLPPVDAVVISHNHYDHLDAPTIARLPRRTPLFVPAGLGGWFRRRRFTRVTELDWWETAELPAGSGVGSVRFEFVPAHHWSKRTLTDTCRSLWGGWILTDQRGRQVYFAGDTGYGHWFKEIGRRHPEIDLALLPIGAYAPRWWLSSVHTDPEEALQAFEDLGARNMAPMHWATFVLSAEPVMEPIRRLLTAWAQTGRPRQELWDLPVGGSRVLTAG
ncbi:MBL fold metallo-hydrolase [Streptomyces sp. NBC_01619]|uniref:MBL fold metallo-hydrolase n=1 Tax=Streptomyces sp. NBC_01619 TaxID=2975901 RepID=UPI00225154F9|nr:MBL fold metallo-hydrolase [Streptomyces sp. NBC_01619]MCX4514493.1 MBL fold metallo-hydrolase [Streptomyces sp. NBC_01619]